MKITATRKIQANRGVDLLNMMNYIDSPEVKETIGQSLLDEILEDHGATLNAEGPEGFWSTMTDEDIQSCYDDVVDEMEYRSQSSEAQAIDIFVGDYNEYLRTSRTNAYSKGYVDAVKRMNKMFNLQLPV